MAISFSKPGAAAGSVGPASSAGPGVAPASAGPSGAGGGAFAPASAAPSPQRAQAAALLVQLFRYLEQHLDAHPALTPTIAALRDAVAEYRSGGGADPLRGVRTVVVAIQSARASDPALPEP